MRVVKKNKEQQQFFITKQNQHNKDIPVKTSSIKTRGFYLTGDMIILYPFI